MTSEPSAPDRLRSLEEPRYLSASFLRADIRAGLVVFLVAVPLCLGVALASGAPLMAGLISGIVGGVVVSVLSGSQLSVSGPAAGLTVIVAAGIAELGFEVFLAAVILAGILQVLLGVFRAGTLSHYFPNAVVEGMMAAIGIIIIFKQLPHAVGYDADHEGDLSFLQPDKENTFSELLQAFAHIEWAAILISVVGFAIVWWYASDKLPKPSWLPSSLLIVLVGVAGVLLLPGLGAQFVLEPAHLVQVPNLAKTPASEWVHLPDFSRVADPRFITLAVTLAIVASLESLLSVSAVDKIDPLKRRSDTNRELSAQGAGNILSGLLGGLPVTAVIVRSATNVTAGAITKTSGFAHGVLLLVFVVALPSLLNLIPLASLAVILIAVGYKLASPSLFVRMFKRGWDQLVIFGVTLLVILFTDLLIGIGAGLAVGVLFILRRSVLSLHLSVRSVPGSETEPVVIRLSDQVSFLQKETFLAELDRLPSGRPVIIDASHTQFLDPDIREVIADFKEQAVHRGIELELRGFGHIDQSLVSVNRLVGLSYSRLLSNNRLWAEDKRREDADFFKDSAKEQLPAYYFLTCSDSRILVNMFTGTDVGEVFIHRNVANQAPLHDPSLNSGLLYAVDVLKVKHLIVCGHYGCGGVEAAMKDDLPKPLNDWLSGLKEVYREYRSELELLAVDQRSRRLVELNVLRQVRNLVDSDIVRAAWARLQPLEIHGWVYNIHDGLVIDMKVHVTGPTNAR
jgi:carbonic anhydrase